MEEPLASGLEEEILIAPAESAGESYNKSLLLTIILFAPLYAILIVALIVPISDFMLLIMLALVLSFEFGAFALYKDHIGSSVLGRYFLFAETRIGRADVSETLTVLSMQLLIIPEKELEMKDTMIEEEGLMDLYEILELKREIMRQERDIVGRE